MDDTDSLKTNIFIHRWPTYSFINRRRIRSSMTNIRSSMTNIFIHRWPTYSFIGDRHIRSSMTDVFSASVRPLNLGFKSLTGREKNTREREMGPSHSQGRKGFPRWKKNHTMTSSSSEVYVTVIRPIIIHLVLCRSEFRPRAPRGCIVFPRV